jgi:hypothetical protein
MAPAAAIAASPVVAQSDAWDWRFTPYLWSAGIDGDVAIGPIGRDVDIEFADLLDVLAGAALFRVEGGNDAHGLLADFVWMRLEPDDELATIGGSAAAELDSAILDVGYLRRLERADLELGVRYWDFELELDPALLPEIVRDDSWVDGYVGVRFIRELDSDWLWQTRVNIGAGGSDFTFNAETHFAKRLSSGNRLVFGIKMLGIDYSDESAGLAPLAVDTTFVGGTIGFTFEYCSQMRAQGRPYISGTSSSIVVPGVTGVDLPSIGKIVCTHSMNGCGSPSSKPLSLRMLRMMRTGSTSASGS